MVEEVELTLQNRLFGRRPLQTYLSEHVEDSCSAHRIQSRFSPSQTCSRYNNSLHFKAIGSCFCTLTLRCLFQRFYKLEKWKCWLLSCVWLFATAWTLAHQAPLSVDSSRQEYWSGLPFPSPGDLPHPGLPEIAKVDSLPQSHQGSPFINWRKNHICDETKALWPGHSLSGWHAVSFLLLLGSVHFIFPLSWRPQASLLTAPHPQPLPNDAHVPGSRQCWPSHISVALQHDLQQGRLPVTLGSPLTA